MWAPPLFALIFGLFMVGFITWYMYETFIIPTIIKYHIGHDHNHIIRLCERCQKIISNKKGIITVTKNYCDNCKLGRCSTKK